MTALALMFVPSTLAAQDTGYELALDGPTTVRMGRTARYRGTAYRVRGLASLSAFEGRVRARIGEDEGEHGAWAEVRSSADGRFEIEAPVPSDVDDELTLEVEVGPEADARTFAMRLSARPAVTLVLRTDRVLYETGEPVHVWAWLREGVSSRPLAGQNIELSLTGDSMPEMTREVTTGPSGVAHLELTVPEGAPEGSMRLLARVPGQMSERAAFRVGTRVWERLFASVEVEPEPVAPGAQATVNVTVTATSGAPVTDATVTVRIENADYQGTTGPDGVAAIRARAPSYLTHDTGSISVRATIHHPGHGQVNAFGQMRLAVPLSLSIEAVPRHGGLVPEIDDVLFVRLHDGIGEPPAQPTEVTVRGPAVVGGVASATTDANGIAEIPVRLPIGASSLTEGEQQTSVLVSVAGPLERLARVYLPVFSDAEVAPTPDLPVAAPGDTVEVEIARRLRVARHEVVLELLDASGEILFLERVRPAQRRVSVTLPRDRLGVLRLRARAVHADETLEGVGTLAQLIVRPADPGFVTLAPARERWTVGETAHVTLTTSAGGPTRWAAVMVRDLAAHDGELPFQHHFLGRRFEEALLTPSDAVGQRLVFASLAASLEADPAPDDAAPLVDALGLRTEESLGAPRGGLRDPWPLGHELERRGVGRWMRGLEAALGQALASDGLDAISTTGRRRAFREDALRDHRDAKTLGGEPLTPQMIEASDPSFTYDAVARRVARVRLVSLLTALAVYLDPGDEASPAARMAAREPSTRWLPRMVERGLIRSSDLDDPWGGRFALRTTTRPILVLSSRATTIELVSPGPDGRMGTRDDVRDPFERIVPAGTTYAIESGEDALMRQLALLSPVDRTLRAIRESYSRVSAEMSEDEIGDAVAAEVSEGTIGLGNLGLMGHGSGGGGSGSGYGRGAGGMRGRSSRVPRVRTGMASVSGLAAVIRERFPPTLLFRPSLVVDASGTTDVVIPLADAVTTYLVEVVVWREDGWVWSDSTRIEVDRDIVVTAPVPAVAHRGDRITLPVRVSNRGDEARELEVRVGGSEALGVPGAPSRRVTVGPGDARAVEVELAPTRNGEGHIEVAVVTPDGVALDAVRLPMRVVDVARRVVASEDTIAAGRATITLDVPEGADPREGGLSLTVGQRLFRGDGARDVFTVWAPDGRASGDLSWSLRDSGGVTQLAFAIGGAWGVEAIEDDAIERAVDQITAALEPSPGRDVDEQVALSQASWALLGMYQLVESPEQRDLPRARDLVARLRREVGASAMASSEPAAWTLAAAALGWTATRGDLERTRELVRRLARHTVAVGDDRWLALETDAVRGSVLWAMAELALGEREQAFAILATVDRWTRSGHPSSAHVRGLARAAVQRMTRGRTPERATVSVDGAAQVVELSNGAARVDAPELAEAGSHRVVVSVAEGAPVFVRVDARYGVPWSAPPAQRGPLALSIEGEMGSLETHSALELTVRNRAPRTLRSPIIEVQLPTGAELTAVSRGEMGVRVQRVGDLLVLQLPRMRPGNERVIPLAIRWSVAGSLRGLGVSGRADERPEAVSVLPPRAVRIEGGAR